MTQHDEIFKHWVLEEERKNVEPCPTQKLTRISNALKWRAEMLKN